MSEEIRIQPQPGPQESFLATSADIAIYGGAAGGGKSYGLLLEPLRHINVRGFGAVVFRRNATDVTNEGGLWDESEKLYVPLGSKMAKHKMLHRFPGRAAKVKFAHLEHAKSVFNWQGAQICYLAFDELTHFEEGQFFYMLSRNRSVCGVRPYVRAATNPDPDSWVARFIEWWIDQNEGTPGYGYPIPGRSGKLRWFIRQHDALVWGDSKEELIEKYGRRDSKGKPLGPNEPGQIRPKSVTFIAAKISDNKKLLEKDPDYMANLQALPYVDRMRLLEGNWKVRPVAGLLFKRAWFEIVDAAPKLHTSTIRYWDRAGTEPSPTSPNPDWTAGVKITKDHKGIFYVEHVERLRKSAHGVETTVVNTASQDGINVAVGLEQDPGQAGKAEAGYHVRALAGYNVNVYPVTKDKVTRAKPASAQAEAGNIKLVRGPWNETFLTELEGFPPEAGKGKDDQVDGFTGGFNALCDTSPAAVRVLQNKDPNKRVLDVRSRKGKGLM
jgi:predicted phage terminase large subunit-like protein